MALSEELTKLAARAKTAEDRVASAQEEARAKLQNEVHSTAGLARQADGSAAPDGRGESWQGRAMVERRAKELG